MQDWQQARFEKGTLRLEQDLLGDWILLRANGRIKTRLGRIRKELYNSYAEGKQRFVELSAYRIKRRKYLQVS
jgi:hypothetical protein